MSTKTQWEITYSCHCNLLLGKFSFIKIHFIRSLEGTYLLNKARYVK